MENENDILSKIPLEMPVGPYLLGYAQAVSDLNKDWDTFRREAAKDMLSAIMVQNGQDFFSSQHHPFIVKKAIELTDELIKQLREGGK